MNTAVNDWRRWRESWNSPGEPGVDQKELRSDIDRAINREERRLRSTQLKVAIVIAVVLLSVAGALLHEARPLDFVFAGILFVAVIVVAALEVESGRFPIDASARPTQVFVELSTARLRRELRMSRLILVPLLVELGFFMQWWIGGIPFHEHEPLAPVVVLTGWLPLFGMVAVLIWASRLSARVRADLSRLASLSCREDDSD
jgi:hypothetical protein